MKDQAEFYDRIHSERLSRFRANPALLRGVSLPMDYFLPNRLVAARIGDVRGKTLLDLGCGEGGWAVYWAAQGARVTASDISPVNVAIAQLRAEANGLRVAGVVASATDTGLPSGSFDVILSAALVHHLTVEQERALYAEVLRLLRPGGLFVAMESLQNSRLLEYVREVVPIRDPVDPRPSRWSRAWKAYQAADPHPRRPNTTAHYREALTAAGFAQFTIEEVGIFSRLDRLLRGHPRAQRFVHDADYRLRPVLPGRLCRNAVITARK